MNAFAILMIGAAVLIVLLAGIVGMRGWRRRDRGGDNVNPPPGYFGGNTNIHTAHGMRQAGRGPGGAAGATADHPERACAALTRQSRGRASLA